MAKGSRGGKIGAGSIGEVGTGVKYISPNGKTYNYFISPDGSLRDIVSGNKVNKANSGKETAKRMIESGKATFLEKSQVNELKEKRFAERAERPDYELGNPFNERGRAKRVYRPRKSQ